MDKKFIGFLRENPIAFLLSAYIFAVIIAFILFKIFNIWWGIRISYLIWPYSWLELSYFQYSQPLLKEDGIITFAIFILFSLGIAWGVIKRRTWFGPILVVFLMYIQIFLLYVHDTLGV